MPYLIFVLLVALVNVGYTPAAQADEVVAVLYSKEGVVEAQFGSDPNWIPIDVNAELHSQDAIRVSRDGRAGLSFRSGNFVRLSNNALLRFSSDAQGNSELEQPQGKSFFFSREEKRYPTIRTPLVTAAVRGTEFTISVEPDRSEVAVMHGQVALNNSFGAVTLSKGEVGVTLPGSAPQKSILVNPVDAVQWALNYPILDPDTQLAKYQVSQAAKDGLSRAQEFLRYGSTGEAQSQLDRAEEALRTDSSSDSNAFRSTLRAQRAVIDIVQNRLEHADSIMQMEQSNAATSAAVAIALSYLYQARGDIASASHVIARALDTHTQRADLWARKAELDLGSNEVESAAAAVSRALEINPNDAYAHAVQGFIHLFMRQVEEAMRSLDTALTLDSALALAHLGRGLILTQKGEAQSGIAEFQKAVVLQPQAGIYRSYLGKGFFESENEDAAASEYELAMSLDKEDPTPWLYRGFLNLSQNKPVAALSDIEHSIALNEGRAVYRSRMLLDQDLGVRSAGLARIFDALDFNEVARIEAIKSIYKDYRNYSAHRLLSESQDTIFLADASFSERRIADILAPLSFNLFNSIGGEASFNDYDALFDKDENRTGINGIYDGRDEIYSGEAFRAGKSGDFGYFLSASSDFADGTKHNDFLRDYRIAMSGQYQPTWEDRILVEGQGQFRDQEAEKGSPQESDFRGGQLRFGYNRRIDARSTLIGEVNLSEDNTDSRDLTALPIIVNEIGNFDSFSFDDEALVNEYLGDDVFGVRSSVQYLYSSPYISLVGGTQVLNQKIERSEEGLIVDDAEGVFSGLGRYLDTVGDNSVNSYDFFLYTVPHPFRWLDLDIGITGTVLDLENRDITPYLDGTKRFEHASPKLGFLLYPATWATVRGGYYETLRKSSLEDQASLEPTMVGGLNQRFNDLSGSESRNLGVGLDFKLAATSYIGAEWTRRHVIEPFYGATHVINTDFVGGGETVGVSSDGWSDEHLDQDIVRSYWYQVLLDELVSSVEYQYTNQTRTNPDFPQEFDNHRFRLGARYFHDSGLFVFSRATWRHQDLTESFFFDDGTRSFWIFDAGLGYRIPKRHGTVTLEFNNIGNHEFLYDNSLGFEEFTGQEFTVRLVGSINF